jgi:MipA family protein
VKIVKIKDMNRFLTLKVAILFTCLGSINLSYAEDKIDRNTETAIPRAKNLYGIGVAIFPKTSGSDEFRVLALPVINANYGDRYYINALQAGVWLIDSDDKRLRFGLSTQARFGWDADDGKLTKGMADRDFSFDFGPTLRWQTDYGTINAQWGFDIGGASHGQTVDLQYIKSIFSSRTLRVNSNIGVTWNDQKLNDYYFGVGLNETSPLRPNYVAGSGVEFRAGFTGAYSVTNESFLLFGASLTRLSDQQANSPIVETRMQPFAFVGYSVTY